MNKLCLILLLIVSPISQAKNFHCYAFGYSYNYDAKKFYISNVDKFKTLSSNHSHLESYIKKHWGHLFQKKVGNDLHYTTFVKYQCEYSKRKFDAKKQIEYLRNKEIKQFKQQDEFRVKKIFGLSLPNIKYI